MRGGIRVLVLVNLVPLFAFAQNSLQTQLKNEKKKLGLSMSATSASSLQEPGSSAHTAESSLYISASLSLKNNYKLRGVTGMLQEHTGGQRTMMSNSKFSLSKSPIKLNNNLSWIPTASLVLPTNPEGRKSTTYQGTVSLEPKLLHPFRLLRRPWDGVYGLTLSKSSHELTLSKFGTSNISHSITESGDFSTQVAKKFTLGVEFSWQQSWTYRGTRKDNFSIGQYVTYAASEKIYLSLGHSNQASLLKPNGRDNNVGVFNDKTSQIYANLRALF